MIDHKTSAGMSILVHLGRFLFHEKFRLPFDFSDCHCGSQFEISDDDCIAHHGFSAGKAESAVDCLKFKDLPIGPFSVVKHSGSFSFFWCLP